MPVTHGPNDYADARDDVKTSLDALVTQMTTDSVSPIFVTVMDDPTANVGLTAALLPAVGVSILEVHQEMRGVNAGPVSLVDATVGLRIMIANANEWRDERTYFNLANSVTNWFEEHRALSARYALHGPFDVTGIEEFEDNKTVGGVVSFQIRTQSTFTAA